MRRALSVPRRLQPPLQVAKLVAPGGWAWAIGHARAHLDEPVNENGPHGGIDIALRLHVLGGDAEDQLPFAQVRVDVFGIRVAALKVCLGLIDY